MSAFPDVTTRQRKPQDQFIMLACDGIWDCLTNQECCTNINEKLKKHKANKQESKMSTIVAEIFDEILAPNTDDGIGTDNMTAILICMSD